MWQEVRLHSLCSTGLFGARRDKPNQLKSVYRKWGQQTRSALQRRTPTPNFLGEESSTFKAMLLIRLHFRALVRNQNAQGIKCYLHTKLKRKNVAKCFLLSTKPPLRSHWSGSGTGPGTWSCPFDPPSLCLSAVRQPLRISPYLYSQAPGSRANIPFRRVEMAAYVYTGKTE